MGLLVCPRAELFHNGVGPQHTPRFISTENGHSAVKAAEPQQLSHFYKLARLIPDGIG